MPAIGLAFVPSSIQPTPTAGLACIGVYGANNDSFVIVDSAGRVSVLANPFDDWRDIGSSVPACTTWFNNAQLAIVELSPEDYGSPVAQKDYNSVRLNWRTMQRVYCGVAIKSGIIRDYMWGGTVFPYEEQIILVTSKGTRSQIRLLIVCFNGAPACLPDLTIGYSPGSPA